jgi:hypothetical protein
MMAHRKTITVTALHARLKKAIAALGALPPDASDNDRDSNGALSIGFHP